MSYAALIGTCASTFLKLLRRTKLDKVRGVSLSELLDLDFLPLWKLEDVS